MAKYEFKQIDQDGFTTSLTVDTDSLQTVLRHFWYFLLSCSFTYVTKVTAECGSKDHAATSEDL